MKRDNHAVPTCYDLKQHVEEEMLAASVDKGISVESPELHLFVQIQDAYFVWLFSFIFVCFVYFFDLFILIQDKWVIPGEVITVLIPAKRLSCLCDADVVIDEKADLQQSYADDENWTATLFLKTAFFASLLVHFFSQG